ncbi:MAG: hypothetical protein FWG81_09850 [Betaproteobacteria bacterium]|nr:hypothetical protein [Betaproteobacteria bacterium]
MRRFSVFCLVLLLAACTNDGAFFSTDNGQQILSVVRESTFFWEKKAKFFVTISRLPDCQRRHLIQTAGLKTHVELWQPGDNTFILRLGNAMYVVENRTCEGFARLEEEPPGGLGQHLGTFGESRGVFVFVAEEPKQPAEAGGN